MPKVSTVVRKSAAARKAKANETLGEAIRAGLLSVKEFMDATGKAWVPVATIVFMPEGETAISARIVVNKLGQMFWPEIIEFMRQKVAEADEEGDNAWQNTNDATGAK